MALSTPTIRELRVRAVRVPLPETHATASGTIAESPLVLTDIACDDGSVGHSITFTYTPLALKPTGDLIASLSALLAGQPAAPLAIDELLTRRFRLLGPQGLVGMALAGIDMALWDAQARRHGVALATLLGAPLRPCTPYAPVGYDGVDGAARSAERWARRGFRAVKAKIGYPTLAEDLAVVRAMRRAVGPDVAIMVDYNQSLLPVDAVQRARALDGEGLTWIEEPVLAQDFAGTAEVARAAATPIQAGENWWGVPELRQAIAAGATDVVMPDVMKMGGVTGFLRAATLAHAHGLKVSNHLWPEISAQLLAATPTAHWLEWSDWWNAILAEPLRVSDGLAHIDGTFGSGVAWNEAAVTRYLA